MSIKDEKEADLAKILDAVGETVTWDGYSFKALVSDPAIGEQLNLGGFTGTGDFTIKIPRRAFRSRHEPKLGSIIGFNGNRFRVTRITNHPQYPMFVLVVSPVD